MHALPRSRRRLARAARDVVWLVVIASGAVVALGGFAPVATAGALQGSAGPISVTVTVDGGAATIKADAPDNILIYEIAAHLCKPGAQVNNTYDFGFQGNSCTNAALPGGDTEKIASFPNGTRSGTLKGFKFGAGSTQWVNELGYPFDIACGPGQPCDVVAKVQITNSTVFFTAPLCFGGDCPADPPPTTAGAAGTNAPPGSTQPSAVTSTTTVPVGATGSATTTAPRGARGDTDGSRTATTVEGASRNEEALSVSSVASAASDSSRAWRMTGAMVASALGGARIVSVLARLRRRQLQPRMA